MNRYTQVKPAKFTPFSMEQILFPAMTMRQQHDEVSNKLIEMEAMDSMRLPTDEPIVSEFYNKFRSNLDSTASELAKEGFSSPIKDKLTNLHREYTKFTSPSQIGGKAQQNYMEAMEGWRYTRDQLAKQGASPDYIREAQKDYLTGAYQGVVNEDGTFNEFTPGRVVNFYDIPKEIMDLFSQVGSTEDLNGIENYDFDIAPNGALLLVNRHSGTIETNKPQLTAAANALMSQYMNPEYDRGWSAIKQKYTPQGLMDLLNNMKDTYYTQKIQPIRQTVQNLGGAVDSGSKESDIVDAGMFGTYQTEAKNLSAGSGRRELTGLMGRGEQPYELVTHSVSSNYNNPDNKVFEGPYTLTGPYYVTAMPGTRIAPGTPGWDTRKASNMPVGEGRGATLADVKEVGYVTLYEIEDVEPITENLQRLRDEGIEITDAAKARKEYDRVYALARMNPDNKSGGALVGVGDTNKDEKNASLYGLPSGSKAQIDSQGRYFFIHGDEGGQVKVYVRPKFLKEVIGRRMGVKKDEAKDSDYVRAFVPTTRQEAIKELGVGAGVEAPIGVHYTVNSQGNYVMNVLQNQPILDENRVRTMAANAINFITQMQATGNLNDPYLLNSLRAVNVVPETLIQDFELLSNRQFVDTTDPNNERTGTILDYLFAGIQHSSKVGVDGARAGSRVGSGNIILTPREKQAVDNFLNFLFAYEVSEVYTPKNKKQ